VPAKEAPHDGAKVHGLLDDVEIVW
jgi:hypothetical protein